MRAHRKSGLTTSLLAAALAAGLLLAGCAAGSDTDSGKDAGTDTPGAADSPATSPKVSKTATPAPSAVPPSSTPVPSKPAPSQSEPSKPAPSQSAPSASASAPKTRRADDLEVLVNKRVPLQPADYAPTDLVAIGNGQQLRAQAGSAYQQLVAAAGSAGFRLTPSSAYRSYATQVQTHNHWKNQYGAEYAEKISARPGHSEHQTGLAVDVMPASGQCRLEQCFGQLPEGKWVAANAHRFGFIIRYPQGQDGVTGYSYEPWHLRFVGVETATAIKNSGQTMEAYYGFPAAPSYR